VRAANVGTERREEGETPVESAVPSETTSSFSRYRPHRDKRVGPVDRRGQMALVRCAKWPNRHTSNPYDSGPLSTCSLSTLQIMTYMFSPKVLLVYGWHRGCTAHRGMSVK
jgi:hypothetical protein